MRQWQITDEWRFDGLKLVETAPPAPGEHFGKIFVRVG